MPSSGSFRRSRRSRSPPEGLSMHVALMIDLAGGGWAEAEAEAAFKLEGVEGQDLPAHELGSDDHNRCVDYRIQNSRRPHLETLMFGFG